MCLVRDLCVCVHECVRILACVFVCLVLLLPRSVLFLLAKEKVCCKYCFRHKNQPTLLREPKKGRICCTYLGLGSISRLYGIPIYFYKLNRMRQYCLYQYVVFSSVHRLHFTGIFLEDHAFYCQEWTSLMQDRLHRFQ